MFEPGLSLKANRCSVTDMEKREGLAKGIVDHENNIGRSTVLFLLFIFYILWFDIL